jgi:hypothetical protein
MLKKLALAILFLVSPLAVMAQTGPPITVGQTPVPVYSPGTASTVTITQTSGTSTAYVIYTVTRAIIANKTAGSTYTFSPAPALNFNLGQPVGFISIPKGTAVFKATAAGGGSGATCALNNGILVQNGSTNTTACDPQFLWDLTNHAAFVGPAESTLPAEMQGWFASYPLSSELVNSTRVNGVGILQSLSGNAFWAAAFATSAASTAASTGQGISDIASGTIPELIGVDATTINLKGGTITNAYDFLSDTPGTNTGSTTDMTNLSHFAASRTIFDGSGTATNVFGFRVMPQHQNAHVTNTYGFYGEDTGAAAGSVDWNFYSAGGKNKFISGAGQIDPVMNFIGLPWTGTPRGGTVGIFGSGLGLDPSDGTPVVLEIGQESSANTEAFMIWNKTAPAGNSFYEYMDDTGLFALNHSSNGVEFDTDFFNADGSRTITLPATKTFGVTHYGTVTNCSSAASPAVCAAATAGSVVVAAAATSVVVNTSEVTANSQIFIQFDSSLGTKLGVTCNATVDLGQVTARSAGVSFTITSAAAPAVNPACYSYFIVN